MRRSHSINTCNVTVTVNGARDTMNDMNFLIFLLNFCDFTKIKAPISCNFLQDVATIQQQSLLFCSWYKTTMTGSW